MRKDASTGSSTRQVEANRRLTGGALQHVRAAVPRSAAHRVGHVAHRRVVPQSVAKIPLARQLLHHRLVPAVARGRARGCGVARLRGDRSHARGAQGMHRRVQVLSRVHSAAQR